MSLSKNINHSLVLVQPKKTRPNITERLLMGRKESNQICENRKVFLKHPLKNKICFERGLKVTLRLIKWLNVTVSEGYSHVDEDQNCY